MTDLSLPQNTVVEEEKDVLGDGLVLESGLYKGIVEMAYLDSNQNGTKLITIHFKRNGRVFKFTNYISNQQGSFTYVDKKTQQNKPLPGYLLMDSFFKAVTGSGIAEQATTAKMVKVWNPTTSKEEPKEVQVFEAVLNKPLSAGILKVSSEKTTPESGYKQGTGEFRDSNEFNKFFDAETGQTVSEKAANQQAAFLLKWKERNDNKTRVKKAPIPGTATNTATAGTTAGMPAGNAPDPFEDS